MGSLLGLAPVAFVAILLVRVFSEGGGAEALIWLGLFTLLGAFEGAVVGLAQWLVLRQRLPGLTRRSWVWATIIGAVATWFLGMLPGTIMSVIGNDGGDLPDLDGTEALVMETALAIMLGAILAIPQWWVLRRHVGMAGWWLPANALAWAVAMPLIILAAGLPLPNSLFPLLAIAAAMIVGVGAVTGAIHGAVLVRLLRGA